MLLFLTRTRHGCGRCWQRLDDLHGDKLLHRGRSDLAEFLASAEQLAHMETHRVPDIFVLIAAVRGFAVVPTSCPIAPRKAAISRAIAVTATVFALP
jgi:hypothetical protein